MEPLSTVADRRLILPRLVVATTASADGRVALNRSTVLLDPLARRTWRALHSAGAERLLAERREWIESQHHPRVTMEGSGTFVAESAGPAPELAAADAEASILLESYLPQHAGDQHWFVVVDGRGRVRWTNKGDGRARLLILVCRSTPLVYLAYLRHENIAYLVAGDHQVDLVAALALMKTRLGTPCVVSAAGGGLNAALLRAGLVDELHLILLPSLIGGRDTPSIFDGEPLGSAAIPTLLRLVNVRTSSDGAVWLHYVISHPGEPNEGARGA